MFFRTLSSCGFALIAAIGACGTAFADDDATGTTSAGKDKIEISGNDHKRSFQCDGRRAIIEGNDNVITFTGVCSSLNISGTGNSVTIELAPKAPLSVEGVDNSVRWQSTAEPKKNISGVNNRVMKIPGRS
ncbi:DUF3060 domain-containing protein [Massilia atriviolacea]|uniref:DUF3060 domain-containing protein n=1 Tax=Massilia atriviolacea TaxID=2495579 RepID=A0A430HEI4_9BURK|nr:DUF3060 domain-containing protein [Massilia atriviolacea]RSZ55897.1 DUF3060 domain-containing protein [Massilia atriviolacea]